MSIQSINPATGDVIETFQETTPQEVERILGSAQAAFHEWRALPFATRAQTMQKAASLLRARKTDYARTMALEMGKPIVQGEAEVEKCAWVCEYYAQHAEAYLAPQPRDTDASVSYVRFDPLGPVLAVMPWNFPFWQVFRFAAPGLMADPRIVAVTLTGSEHAGSQVAERAGHEIKKTVLELGGSDPFIVLADADVAAAARTAADARLVNSGQSCIAAKRFIVVEAVADRFLTRFVEELRGRKMGDPLARDTQVGPQARVDLRDALHRQVDESIKRGARRLLGGEVPAGPGAFYPPTLLTAVDKGMPAFDEETFGPVAAVIRARDEADAIRLANDSAFGLGAAIWTRDRARAERMAG